MQEKIVILDFGSQFTQLIARRVRELRIYCEIHPFNNFPEIDGSVKGIILSGSPYSVRQEDAPHFDFRKFHGKLPLLGVCYGAQYLAHFNGGEVLPSSTREYGRANLQYINHDNPLLKMIPADSQVWMSHGDTIASLADDYEVIASTDSVRVAAYHVKGSQTYGIQFHPEVTHSVDGKQLLHNFLVDICGCSQDWTPDAFVETTIAQLKEKLGDDKVVLGLSGGVDSSVAAVLLHHAIGKNLHCIFVDNGLLRKDEYDLVLDSYKHMGLNIRGIDAKQRFYDALAGLTDP
ncbi:MAG: glutamine-hydrolyzing GMP synthase, partial [Sphingobacteriaceae bacterium]